MKIAMTPICFGCLRFFRGQQNHLFHSVAQQRGPDRIDGALSEQAGRPVAAKWRSGQIYRRGISGQKLEQTPPSDCQDRVAYGLTVSPILFHCDQFQVTGISGG